MTTPMKTSTRKSILSATALVLLALLGSADAVAAQTGRTGAASAGASPSGEGTPGVIIAAHGADEGWNAPVLELAERVEARTGWPTDVALLMGDFVPDHLFQDAVAEVVAEGADHVVVVPLLASSHSAHYDQVAWLGGRDLELEEYVVRMLDEGGIERSALDVPMTVTPAIDASREIAGILADRALALASAPTEQALFIVGHGPNEAEAHAEWMKNLRMVADDVATRTGFRDVKLGLLRDDAPDEVRAQAVLRIREIIELQRELTGAPVVVVPILVSRGYISTRKLPQDLSGLDIVYDGQGLLPHPDLAVWVERRVREAG